LGGSSTPGGLGAANREQPLPQVALDPAGRPVVAWRTSGAVSGIHLRRWDGDRWIELGGSATGRGIMSDEGEAQQPALALDREGRPWVAWGVKSPKSMAVRVRRWSGEAWEDAGALLEGEGHDSIDIPPVPGLHLDSSGRAVVAWHYTQGNGRLLHCRRLEGNRWTDLEARSATGALPNHPFLNSLRSSLAVDREGNPWLAWAERIAGRWQIYVLRRGR
jgi:hypothetical protein